MATHLYRLLIVDDIPDNLFLLQTILEAEGFLVDVAANGGLALSKIQASPPDLVLLDVMMPGMTGYEVTQCIRQDLRLSSMPILLLTAHDEVSALRGLELGANDFIRKPIDFDELLTRIRFYLHPDSGQSGSGPLDFRQSDSGQLDSDSEARNSMQFTNQTLRSKQPLSHW